MQAPISRLIFTLFAAVLLYWVFVNYPTDFETIVYKFSMVFSAAVVGYWIDFLTNPSYRPRPNDDRHPTIVAAMNHRRAIIMAGTIIGVTMAL
jgi:hypothetical protein